MSWSYRWQYPMRAVLCDQFPGRVMRQARAAAIRDAADDGWRPGSIPCFTVLPTASDDWRCLQVTFDAVPVEPAAPLPEPGVCVDCGERPGWGPGAVRCRVCFSERAAFEPDDPDRLKGRTRKRRQRARQEAR